jgi:broad specificity phosphatase PhoE
MKKIMNFLAFILAFMFFIPAVSAADSEVTRIILVRHGETPYNKVIRYQGWTDIPLNETGIRQAELLAQSLKDVPIDVFISSPLQRAYVTTQKVAELHNKTIEYTDPRLKEIDFGDWTGKYAADLQKKYPEQFAIWTKKPWLIIMPNGESLEDMQMRGRAALNDIVALYPGKTIFIGAHSLLNATILCSVLDISLEHFNKIPQSNTCVNVLEYKDGAWKVLLMNSTTHLNRLY